MAQSKDWLLIRLRRIAGSIPARAAIPFRTFDTKVFFCVHPLLPQMFQVYVIQNPDGKIYIGQTSQLDIRLKQHNDPEHTLTRTTKRFKGPWILVYQETLPDRSSALKREKALKSGQGRQWLKVKIGC